MDCQAWLCTLATPCCSPSSLPLLPLLGSSAHCSKKAVALFKIAETLFPKEGTSPDCYRLGECKTWKDLRVLNLPMYTKVVPVDKKKPDRGDKTVQDENRQMELLLLEMKRILALRGVSPEKIDELLPQPEKGKGHNCCGEDLRGAFDNLLIPSMNQGFGVGGWSHISDGSGPNSAVKMAGISRNHCPNSPDLNWMEDLISIVKRVSG